MYFSFTMNRRRHLWNKDLLKSLIKVCSCRIRSQLIKVVEFEFRECDIEFSVKVVMQSWSWWNLKIIFWLFPYRFLLKFVLVWEVASFLLRHKRYFLHIVSSSRYHKTISKSVWNLFVFLKLQFVDHKSIYFRIHRP